MKKIIFILLFSHSLIGNTYPNNGDIVSTLHILLKWPAESGITQWEIQFENSNGQINTAYVNNTDLNGDGYIQYEYKGSSFLTWNQNYSWKWRSLLPSISNWSTPINFSIGASKANVTVTLHDANNYAEGLTIFSSADGTYSSIIDMYGQEIWNSADQQFIYYNTNYKGNFLGAKYNELLTYQYPSVEFSLNNDVTWTEPNIRDTHHDLIQLPWGDYLGIGHEYQNGPIHAIGYIQMLYFANGYLADGETNEWPWQGDVLIIWDQHTGEEKWTWRAFDHFNTLDYDINSWNAPPNFSEPAYDWTHINAITYNENDNCIYFSSRNLDRITKIQIQYDEIIDEISGGNIIWNMGYNSPSGDVTFGHNLGFSQQHSINLTADGNITMFDNGNYAPAYWGASYSTSRALEVSVSENTDSFSSNIVFEYEMPQNLFGSQSGSMQKLSNGNYLITTIAGNGTSYEVSSNGELIWEANYNSNLMWRANRITILYPEEDVACTIGDLNEDLSYNVLDIISLADCVLENSCFGCAGDINGDLSYNVLDIIALADCVLENSCNLLN